MRQKATPLVTRSMVVVVAQSTTFPSRAIFIVTDAEWMTAADTYFFNHLIPFWNSLNCLNYWFFTSLDPPTAL